jgi:hypothetical protein
MGGPPPAFYYEDGGDDVCGKDILSGAELQGNANLFYLLYRSGVLLSVPLRGRIKKPGG